MEKLEYKGFGNCDSICGFEILKYESKAVVILTELEENLGTSITNFYEHLATIIYETRLKPMPVENVRWLEHYPYSSLLKAETYDAVILKYDGKRFHSPRWTHLARIKGLKVELAGGYQFELGGDV